MLVDTHCHLDTPGFDPDRAQVVARARAAGVLRQVVPAIDAAGWPQLLSSCAADAGRQPACGLQPPCLASPRGGLLSELRRWLERECPVAVGECGLDHFVD